MKRVVLMLFLFLSLTAATDAMAQAARGLVVDASTQQPIAGAVVTIDGSERRADGEGAFDLPADARQVLARAPGYRRTDQPAPLDAAPLTIALTPFRPKAVYLSAYGVANPGLRDAALALKESNGINALVIDLKSDRGQTPYSSAARETIGATRFAPPSPHAGLDRLVPELHRQGFYLIARVVVFKDGPLAGAHPEWAVHDAAGGPWQDREQLAWTDPFVHEVWDHNIAIAEEAARMGFDEVQFDYVRFPDAGSPHFSQPSTRAARVAAIDGFLRAARERLAPYNVFLAADIFGYVCWNADDTAIGQQLETLAPTLDYLSPMLYPSGFTWGLPGQANPMLDPGRIVSRSLAEARRRTGLPGVRFRPWLQAFQDYAFDKREFGAHEIGAQTQAAERQDSDGWMLWNPRNRYDPATLPH
ncbi:putative glycoside hydrolase [Dyella sp. BiH032]|uniref:putative glycoside hydrolase n=1 Tax=Dyella sp. BiH032 TaxID=3075430 RepID=UPI002893064E|nr:putative glycoside hydrolase [Dyella sp. BiH032]WNL44160.1 putative glycoside hydrolase [Dyella sp. BiH032]